MLFSNIAREKKKCVPKLCSNVVNLLLVLQDLLAVSFKQQGCHTQVVGVEALELVIEAVDSWKGGYWWGRSGWTFVLYLSDIKLLQTIQERSENGRHLRLQCMTCDMRQESERSLRNRFFFKHICHCFCLHPSVLHKGKGAVFIWRLQTKGGNINGNIGITLQLPSGCQWRWL